DTVEKASIFLISNCVNAKYAATRAVIVPVAAMTSSTVSSNTGKIRASRNTPAATMVAAWMSDDTDVGPSIAAGSHTCSGNWADLAMAPRKKATPAAVSHPADSPGTATPGAAATVEAVKKPCGPNRVCMSSVP